MTSGRIASACLSLVPLAVADADEMVGVLSADALYAFTGGSPPGLDELRKRYARLTVGRSPDGSQEWCNWIVRREVGGQAVGYVQATIMDGGARAGIAWVIGLDWQGRGYASEAARALVRLAGFAWRHAYPGAYPPRARGVRRGSPAGWPAAHRALRRW